MRDNGHEERGETERVKKCPFLGSWCEKEACALWVELTQNMGGLSRKMGLCAFGANNIMLLEINNKLGQQARQPVQKIVLPGMHG